MPMMVTEDTEIEIMILLQETEALTQEADVEVMIATQEIIEEIIIQVTTITTLHTEDMTETIDTIQTQTEGMIDITPLLLEMEVMIREVEIDMTTIETLTTEFIDTFQIEATLLTARDITIQEIIKDLTQITST